MGNIVVGIFTTVTNHTSLLRP